MGSKIDGRRIGNHPKDLLHSSVPPHAMNKKLSITVAELSTGVQEIVLVERHGRISEEDENHRSDKNNLYRAVEAQLSHRAIDCFAVVEIPGLEVTIKVNRCYHHEGRLCRIHYVRERGSELREQKGPKAHEIETLQLAAWVASQHFSTPPRGIRLVYHVLPQDDRESPILKSWVVDLPLTEPKQFEKKLASKLGKLRDALQNADDEVLPPCSITERHGTEHRPFTKCKDYCRARHVCRQYAAVKERALGSLEDDCGFGSLALSCLIR